MYETAMTKNITIKFDAKGGIPNEPMHGTNDESTILTMHDAAHPYEDWPTHWETLNECWFQLLTLGKSQYNSTNGLKVKGDVLSLSKGGCDCERDPNTSTSFFEITRDRLALVHGDFLVQHPLDWNRAQPDHWVMTVHNGHK